MKKKYKKCLICGEDFSLMFRNSNSKYCSDKCRKVVSRRSNINQKEIYKGKMKYGTKEFRSREIYKRYMYRAKKNGIPFKLSENDFLINIDNECYYCGEDYKNIGFDRIDGKKGYVLDNIVSCCTSCNFMKRNDDINTFIKKCIRIAKKHDKS